MKNIMLDYQPRLIDFVRVQRAPTASPEGTHGCSGRKEHTVTGTGESPQNAG